MRRSLRNCRNRFWPLVAFIPSNGRIGAIPRSPTDPPFRVSKRNPGLPAARGRHPQSRIPASVTLPPVKAELDAAIARLRDRVAELVTRDGLDAHQVAAT